MKKFIAISLAIAALFCGVLVFSQEPTTNPHGKLKWECSACHSTDSWKITKPPSSFKHAETGFSLRGAHQATGCSDCHKDLTFSHIGTACIDCHTDIHRGQFGNLCENCHLTDSWQNRQEQLGLHSSRGFPLIGIHSIADCGACHVGQQRNEYAGTPVECIGCHRGNYASTTDPNHVLANFNTDCRGCHRETASSWKNATYQHPSTYEIRGAHLSLRCVRCHATAYLGAPRECVGCHLQDYQTASVPPHVQPVFPENCVSCHSEVQWTGATFNHLQATGYDLLGAHAPLHCIDCHINNSYVNTPNQCYGCHQSNFDAATNPNHVTNNFNHDCTVCHNINAWSPATFNHGQTRFALTGAHQTLQCVACHANGYQSTPMDCYSCHQNNFNSASNPNHVTNNFSHDCTQCHSTAGWSPSTFNHSQTRFALTGAHLNIQCVACHSNGYQNTPLDCYSCHVNDFNRVTDPNHVTNNFSHDCTQCHTTASWAGGTFNHSQTRFPLTGAHATIQCIACHANGYQNTPLDCYSCHQSNFDGATNPNHVSNNFSHDCTQCHSNTAWSPSTFNHSQTGFPLTGAHATRQCIDCHANGYQNTPLDCYSCHQSNFDGATNPNHVSNNFSHDCTQCHSNTAWSPSTFNHSQTGFPLTGAHATRQCIDCHANGYQNTPFDCYSCHQSNFNGASNPNHVTNNFSHDCTQCHSTSAWSPATFDHNQTRFPLTGAHVSRQCIDCHANGYQNTPFDCYSCHQSNFNGVSDPNHVTNNFSHDCTQCHSTSAWSPATFDHNQTRFPLTGAHVPLQCVACHANGYQNTPLDCYSCHVNDYNDVNDPNHVANNFSHDCTQCHNTSGWGGGTFNHNPTRFPLTGAHVGLPCASCHANGYQNTPYDCFSCHQNNFNLVPDPNHVSNNFSHECTQCHNTSGWTPALYDHSQTRFPLTGSHVGQACISCHANGYQNTPLDCYSCHQGNYNSVTDPNHATNNFDHDCTQCHNTSVWTPSTFNHSSTQFPLTGAHIALQCISCHANGYQNTPLDCYSCHVGNYNSVPDPNHVTNNFSHDCTVCHSTSGWTPATFNHGQTRFPLTGAHVNLTCISCHANGYQDTPLDCYSCHQGNYNSVTNPNHATNNFSHDCTICHSTSGWTPATFDHSQTPFPLTGAHVTVQCVACHANGYQNTPTDCYSCHQTDYNGVTNPNHSAEGFPTLCRQCHTTANWTQLTYNHDSQYFPITTGRHRTVWTTCATCHNIPGNLAQFECILCHTHSRSQTDSQHQDRSGYQYLSTACYACHPRGNAG